jgi:hypothetical protein
VATDQAGALVPGEVVEVVGFADHGGYAPTLSDAICRNVAPGAPPVPFRLRAAPLSRETRGGAGQRDSGHGVCVSGLADFSRPSGLLVADQMQMLLCSPNDLTVVRVAPWLTTQRALSIAVAVATVIRVALVVVAVPARRQIAPWEKARKLAEVAFPAMLAERNRLARELHNTIAQELNAVSMQLELAKNSAFIASPLSLARHAAEGPRGHRGVDCRRRERKPVPAGQRTQGRTNPPSMVAIPHPGSAGRGIG